MSLGSSHVLPRSQLLKMQVFIEARSLLLLHAGVTLFMMGLIWVIQLVHYPLFALVGSESYTQYHLAHMKRITWIVAPVMLLELISSVAIVYLSILTSAQLGYLGLGLLTFIWICTALFQVPAHNQLSKIWNQGVHARLVRSNWMRTVAWSARGVLALWMLSDSLH